MADGVGSYAPAMPVDPVPLPEAKDVIAAPPPYQAQPTAPWQGYGGTGAGIANIASNFLNGWMLGKHMKELSEQRKAVQLVGSAKANWESQDQSYRHLLATEPAKIKVPVAGAEGAAPTFTEIDNPKLKEAERARAFAYKAMVDTIGGYVAKPKGKEGIGGKLKGAFAAKLPEMASQFAYSSMRQIADSPAGAPPAVITPTERVSQLQWTEAQENAKQHGRVRAIQGEMDQLSKSYDPAAPDAAEKENKLMALRNQLNVYLKPEATKTPTELAVEQQKVGAEREQLALQSQLTKMKGTALDKLNQPPTVAGPPDEKGNPTQVPNPKYTGISGLTQGERLAVGINLPNDDFQAFMQVYGSSAATLDKYLDYKKQLFSVQYGWRAGPMMKNEIRNSLQAQWDASGKQYSANELEAAVSEEYTRRMKPTAEEKGENRPLSAGQMSLGRSAMLGQAVAGNKDFERFVGTRPGPTGQLVTTLNPTAKAHWYERETSFQQQRDALWKTVLTNARAQGMDDSQTLKLFPELGPYIGNSAPPPAQPQGPPAGTAKSYKVTNAQGQSQTRTMTDAEVNAAKANPQFQGWKFDQAGTAIQPPPK